MSYLDIPEIKEELVVFLRNADVFTITQRGVATTTSSFNGDASTLNFTISRTNVKNVRSVTVSSVAKTFGTHYLVNYDYDNSGTIACRISFTAGNAPGSGTNNVVVSYDYGTDKIYPDFPRPDLTLSSYPRIALGILGADSEEMALGGGTISTNLSFTVTVFALSETDLDAYIKSVRNAFLAAKKSFYYLKFITAIGLGPVLPVPERSNKLVMRAIDFMSPLNIEE